MKLKLALIGLTALGGIALASGAASAMPIGLAAGNAASQVSNIDVSNIDQVRYVCSRYGRCWWRPNTYGAYGFYGPRVDARPFGWHRGWHRW